MRRDEGGDEVRPLEFAAFDDGVDVDVRWPSTYWNSSTSTLSTSFSPASKPARSMTICMPPSVTWVDDDLKAVVRDDLERMRLKHAEAARRGIEEHVARRLSEAVLVAVDDDAGQLRAGGAAFERELQDIGLRIVARRPVRSRPTRRAGRRPSCGDIRLPRSGRCASRLTDACGSSKRRLPSQRWPSREICCSRPTDVPPCRCRRHAPSVGELGRSLSHARLSRRPPAVAVRWRRRSSSASTRGPSCRSCRR